MNNTTTATDPLEMVFSEDRAIQGILDALRAGRLEHAVQTTQEYFVQQGFKSGGMPQRLSPSWEGKELTPLLLARSGATEIRLERGHSRFVRGVIRLLRRESAGSDLRSAFDDLAAAASVAPTDAQIRVCLANLIIFNARYVTELVGEACADLRMAKRELKDALALAPGSGAAHHARGLISLFAAGCLRSNGADPRQHYRKAVASFTAAARLDPSHARTHQNLGLAKMGLGRRQDAEAQPDARMLIEAVAHFEQAAQLDPSLWRASYKAAQIYLLLKMGDEARRCVEECRRIKAMRPSRLGKLEGQLWRSVVGNSD